MTGPRNKGRLILIGVLTVSLGLNALALGAGLRLVKLRSDLLGGAFVGLQSTEVRRSLNAALIDHGDEITPALRDMLTARIAAMETGSTQPFDREATLAKMAETRVAMDILLDRVQAALLDGLETYAADQQGD